MADAQALPPIVLRSTQDTGVALLTSAFGGRIEFLPTRPLHHDTGVLGHAQTDAVCVLSPFSPPQLLLLSCSLTLFHSFFATRLLISPTSQQSPASLCLTPRSYSLSASEVCFPPHLFLFLPAPLSLSSLHSLPCFITDLSSLCPPYFLMTS